MAQAISSILQKTQAIPARELMRLFAERHRATQTLAHREAVKAVKQQLRARGIKLHTLKHREIVSAADNYLAEHQAELIPAAQATVERWTAAGFFGKRAQRAFANLTSDAQNESEPKSPTSAVQISGAK